ncbi:MAG TPA: response regulator transcription factor [Candidatus Acidoferrales bacterium]|nr:response regulator transcription factor [Candidatus Acidoferrales bacterium]
MAEQEAKLEMDPSSEQQSDKAIRVILADSEPIFRVGMRKIFALEDDIRLVAQAETAAQMQSAVARTVADILLFETTLSENPANAVSDMLSHAPALKIILVAPELSEEETVDFLRRGVRGIVTRSVSPDLLIKCIRKVHAGESWLDNRGVNWVIEAYRAQASQLTSPRNRVKLTPKEIQIISGVTQGLRNKDIAAEVGTTEQVVKNYLRKVYDKLGVSDRLELALYCMHHRLLEGYRRADGAILAEVGSNGTVRTAQAASPDSLGAMAASVSKR